jgi:hypothetical protein
MPTWETVCELGELPEVEESWCRKAPKRLVRAWEAGEEAS